MLNVVILNGGRGAAAFIPALLARQDPSTTRTAYFKHI